MKFLGPVEEKNYITLLMVKRAISLVDGKVTLDTKIIGYKNKRDWDRIIGSMQKVYDSLLDLNKVSDKLHEILNWHKQEYYPVEDCEERASFLSDLADRKKRMR